jgi:hypothetical protein
MAETTPHNSRWPTSRRTILVTVREIAYRPRRFRFRITSLLLFMALLAGGLAWSGHDERKRAVMLDSIRARGGYVDQSDYGWVVAIRLPADAAMEEMQVLSRMFPKAAIMIAPEPQVTP